MNSPKILLFCAILLANVPLLAQSDPLKAALGKLGGTSSQQADSTENPQLTGTGKVTIVSDSSIVQLERRNRGFKEIKGYRVQIMLGSIESIKSERNKFLSLGLPYSAYLKQVVPEYSLQVGDFTNRMEVEKHLLILREHYPKAFIVVDTIEPQRFSTKKIKARIINRKLTASGVA